MLISNSRGHYKPKQRNLYNAIQVLAEEGVDFTNTVVEFHDYEHGAFTVREYLQGSRYPTFPKEGLPHDT